MIEKKSIFDVLSFYTENEHLNRKRTTYYRLHLLVLLGK